MVSEIFEAYPEWVFELTGRPWPGPCRFQSVTLKAIQRQVRPAFRFLIDGKVLFLSVNSGSTTNEVRASTLIAMTAIHPERMAEISRWSPTGTPPVKKEWCHAS